MKKLIFLLFPVFSYGQISFTHIASGFGSSGIGSVGSTTYTAGKLYIFFAGTTNAGGTPATVSLSGGATVWTQIANVTSDDGTMRLQAFRYAPASNETAVVSISYTGTQDGGYIQLCEVSGAVVSGTNGSDGIIQVVTDAIDTNPNPTITLATLGARGGVIAGFINNANPFGGTAESGWVEQHENGYSTPTTGGYYMTRINTGDNTPTVTAASSNWAGVAIEIRASGRRAVVIN